MIYNLSYGFTLMRPRRADHQISFDRTMGRSVNLQFVVSFDRTVPRDAAHQVPLAALLRLTRVAALPLCLQAVTEAAEA